MFFVYIVASRRNGAIYVGSTDSLSKRIWEHRAKARDGFTAKHGIADLVWCEAHDTREGAFRRERRIKEWRRSWKLMLIESANPTWTDLYDKLVNPGLAADEWLQTLHAPKNNPGAP